MRRSDFHFDLPKELIAQRPLAVRSASRLLCLEEVGAKLEDNLITHLPEKLLPGDLLVFNDTRVIPARLFGAKASGGRLELLVERVVDEHRVLALIRASKPPQAGTLLYLAQTVPAEVIGRHGELFEVRFHDPRPVLTLLDQIGHIPLPPYIDRPDNEDDRERYQTLFAREPGAVAAPTAGLHFDDLLLDKLRARGVEIGFVTLHVGAGTFQPPRVDDLREHRMHAEWVSVSAALCTRVRDTRTRGGRVVAVGTTVVRSLEAASGGGEIRALQGETRLFIHPGYQFKTVDAMVTNFHLPESTLLMLVCAFGGYDRVMRAYRHAVAQRYRFFSYGDAMLLSSPAVV